MKWIFYYDLKPLSSSLRGWAAAITLFLSTNYATTNPPAQRGYYGKPFYCILYGVGPRTDHVRELTSISLIHPFHQPKTFDIF